MFSLIAVGNYYDTIEPNNPSTLKNLKDQLAPLCREKYRRIDRFIQLSLLGSGLCAANLPAGFELCNNTALYMASNHAAIGNTVKVQTQIFKQRQHAKPVNFINTLSNTAGYYVARNLGLNGKNSFVSRGSNGFEAALQLIALDFKARVCKYALLGVVDECLEPIDEHRRRFQIEDKHSIGEGSHWLLLENSQHPSTTIKPLASISEATTLVNSSQLQQWLSVQNLSDMLLFTNFDIKNIEFLGADIVSYLNKLPIYQPNFGGSGLGEYGSRNTGNIMDFLENPITAHSSLLSITTDQANRFHVFHIQHKNVPS